MAVDLAIKNAKICLPSGIVKAGLAVDDQRFFKIAKETNLPSASKTINAKGNIILPGVIDAHVHLRDQGLEYKENFYTGTCAAASGGVTTVIDMPNNIPVTMSVETLRRRIEIAEERSIVNVAFYSALPENPEEMYDIVKFGAKGFKIFLWKKIGGADPGDEKALLRYFRMAAKIKTYLLIHAEDKFLFESKFEELKRRGRNDVRAFLEAHSIHSEVKAIRNVIELSRISGAQIHICHVSAGSSLDAISLAKRDGIKITCEATPHHLLLSSDEIDRCGFIALTVPPLRSKHDQRSLWIGVKSGVVDIIASDHAPHAISEKMRDSVWDVAPGFPGLETMLPLMLTQVNEGNISLRSLVRLMSERPAEIFRIQERGSIKEGYLADFIIVDMKEKWRIDPSNFHSKAKFSPFKDRIVQGRVVKTFVNGELVMDMNEIVGKPGGGKILS